MKKITKSELMAYIYFIIISFFKGLSFSSKSKLYILCYLLGVIFVFFKLFTDKFTRKEVLVIGSLIILGIIGFVAVRETTVLFTAIALICLKNVNIRNVIKVIFWTRLITFIIAIVLPLSGIVEMNTYYFYRASLGTSIMRYSFLYSHPNLAHVSFSIIVVLWGYLYFDKVTFPKILCIGILNYILYYWTFSRAGFIVLTIYIIALYLVKRINFFKKNISKILNLLLLFSIAISFIMAWGYGKYEIFSSINSLFTGRLRYMSMLLNYTPHLFSGGIYDNIKFDNGYFDLIYNCGILSTLWYIIIQLRTNKFVKKNNLEKESLMIAFFIVYNIIENYYASIVMNISLMFFTYIIFDKSKTEDTLDENKKNFNELYIK